MQTELLLLIRGSSIILHQSGAAEQWQIKRLKISQILTLTGSELELFSGGM
jgi:hypothetical protein